MSVALAVKDFWIDKSTYANAERQYYEGLYKKRQIHDIEPSNASITSSKGKFQKSKNKKRNVDVANNSELTTKVNRSENQSLLCSTTNKKKKETSLVFNVNTPNNTINVLKSLSYSAPSETSQIYIPPKQTSSVLNKKANPNNSQCNLVMEIAKAREHIKNCLEKMDGIATLAASPVSNDIMDRISNIEKENIDLKKLVDNLMNICITSERRITQLEEQLKQNSKAAKHGDDSVKYSK